MTIADSSPARPPPGGAVLTPFAEGLASGTCPDTLLPGEGLLAVTDRESPWFQARCPTCGHSFRAGDPVRRLADGTVRHDARGLRCATGQAVDQASEDLTILAEFYEGLRASWPVAHGAEVTRLRPGDPLLDPPLGRVPRHACFVCDHTLRPYDGIVRCPCGTAPERCHVAIHSDPSRQLHCWGSWVEHGQRGWCPRTLRWNDGSEPR